MPGRKIPLVTDEIYHVYNRGINRQPTFLHKEDYSRAVEALFFYRAVNQPIRLSHFLRLNEEKKLQALMHSLTLDKNFAIYAYNFMPNHFHFLVKQTAEKGISTALSNFQNSYTRYFNTKYERDGALFLDQFKAVRIETDEQLLHVSRYIHINQYTSYVVKTLEEQKKYPWSSLPYYLDTENNSLPVEKELVLSFFKDAKDYEIYISNQADYQRELKRIEHLIEE